MTTLAAGTARIGHGFEHRYGPNRVTTTGLAAVDLARAAAEETAGVIGVGDYLGRCQDTRVVSHFFACPDPGLPGIALVGGRLRGRHAPVL